MTMYQAEFRAQQFPFGLLTQKSDIPLLHVSRVKLYAYFLPKIFSKKGKPHFLKSGTSAQLYDILYFSRNSSVKGCCFCFSQEWLFSILFIFIRKSMQWTREHDILLCREVLALEVYKHKKGTNEAGHLHVG